MTIPSVFLVVAFVLFLLGAFPIPTRINLISLGLAFWVLSEMLGSRLIK